MEYELKYGKWPGKGYSVGYPSWILYKDNKAVSAISNDSKDKNHVIIRHIEAFEKGKGYGPKLLFMLLDKGVILETGKPNYNSISSDAYKMNKKIVELINNSNGMYKSDVLGKANNKGKEAEENYKEVINKPDNYHYRWSKAKLVRESIEAGRIPKGAEGDCYKNVQDFLLDNDIPDAVIIHGEVTSKGKTMKHAWIETEDAVYDPTTGIKAPKEKYYEILKPKVDARYTFQQAMKKRFSLGHYGPF